MAHKTIIANWCLTNSTLLTPQVTYYTWINEVFPDYFDIGVKLTIENNVYEGRGTDEDRHLALEKAFAEAIERYLVVQNDLFYYGVSVHSDAAQASIISKNEFTERKTFFEKFRKISQVLEVNDSDFSAPNVVQEAISKENFVIFSKMISGQGELPVVATIIKSKEHADINFIGISAKKSLGEAHRKSLIESYINFLSYLDNGYRQTFFPSKFLLNESHFETSNNKLVNMGVFKDSPVHFGVSAEPYIYEVAYA